MAGRKIANIRLSEATQEYVAWYRKRGKSQNTIGTILSVNTALQRVIGNKIVRNIDSSDVDRYFEARVADGLQQSTLNLHTTRLRLFFAFCERRAFLDPAVMPMDDRDAVKFQPKVRFRLTQEEFPALLDAADNPRDRIVIALALYLLCRSSEIRTIRIADVSMDDDTVGVSRWKTKENDNLPMAAELRRELLWYFDWYREFTGVKELPKTWLVAPSNKRRVARMDPVTKRFVPLPTSEMVLTPEKIMWEAGYAVIVQKALKKLGYDVKPGEGIHTLRRSGATELFDQLRTMTGFDDAMLTVQSMLGHANPQTTLIYLDRKKDRERRNSVIRGKVMYARAATKGQENVTAIRAVGQ